MDTREVPAGISRPVLLTNKDELAYIREKLTDPEYKLLYDEVIRLARSDPDDVTSPLAAAADIDPHFCNIGWRLMGMESVLPAAGVAWHLTGDKSYADWVLPLMQEALAWPHWSDGRHTAVNGYYDAAPETACGMRAMAWALDLFDDILPTDIKRAAEKRIAYLAQRLMEISLSKATRWADDVSDDWSTTMYSAIGHVALALRGVDDRTEEWLNVALERITSYLDSLPKDGGHPSGLARWEFALTHCCEFLEALHRTTGADFRRHPAIERIRRFAVECLSPGGLDVIQIDQGLPLDISNVTRGPLSKILAIWFRDPVIRWAMLSTRRTGYIQAQDLLWYDNSIHAVSPEQNGEGSKIFKDIGWVVMRSGWNRKDNLVAFKSSPYWPGYHHLDQNSFEIFAHGHEIALDSGLGWRAHPNYFERYRDSLAHNVILINSRGQLKHSAENHGELIHASTSDDADYAVGECASVYENASKMRRAILFLKPDIIVIRDIIELDTALPIQWQIHGNEKIEIHPGAAGAVERGFTIEMPDVRLDAFVVRPKDWKYALRRAYKLTDWQTRHESTHPVLTITPDRSSNYEFNVVLKVLDYDDTRKFPGRVQEDGSMLIITGGCKWTVTPTSDGLDYRKGSNTPPKG
ncbi:MAG: heparinase II/III family protein [Armatimonadota bacterium]